MTDTPDTESAMREAERLLNAGELRRTRSLLAPYIQCRVPAALFLSSLFSDPGEGTEAFECRHIELLSEAAELGHAPAMNMLAQYLEVGDMLEQDGDRAAMLFERAAGLGHPEAKLFHGLNLFYGSNGIGMDKEKAVRLLQEAEAEGVVDDRTSLR
ncbi:tetratricopeptide repeat protein [Pseudomonas solani]|uniref:tetratricopeptide repeat protein n=1 Tax=Pseudomonas solani TaxID=2731552 RepID=UPI003C2B8A57